MMDIRTRAGSRSPEMRLIVRPALFDNWMMGELMLKKAAVFLAAMVLATGLLQLGQTPANSAPATADGTGADCPNYMVCVWFDGNYNGARWQVSRDTLIDQTGDGVALPPWIDDEGSAVYNRTGYQIYIFDGSNCGSVGWHRLMPAGQKLTAPGSAINDRISSVQLYGAYPNLCNL